MPDTPASPSPTGWRHRLRWPGSMQARLLTGLMLGGLLAWLLVLGIVARNVREEVGELLDSHLAQAAALLVVQQSHVDADDILWDEMPTLHRYATRSTFQVYLAGVMMSHSANAPEKPLSTKRSGFDTVTAADGSRWRVFAAQANDNLVQIYVGELMQVREGIVYSVMLSQALPLLLIFPLMVLMVWWVVRRSFAPLHGLGQQLAQREPQALHPLPCDALPSELQPLVQALNALLTRMADMLDGERRFTSDAAHELRTPIAAIRAQVQVALGAAEQPQEREAALVSTLRGCDRASRVVDQLLVLARLDASEQGSVSAVPPFNLTAVVQQVLVDVAQIAWDKEQTLELITDESKPVETRCGNPILWSILLRNLVDNALRYSPYGATVQLHLDQSAQGVSLSVHDSGAGMSAADIQRLGERFFRVKGTQQDGSGLGWSIVRRIAHQCGLQVQVQRSDALGGLAVMISGNDLPGAPLLAP